MEKLRMFFINAIQNQGGGTTFGPGPAGGNARAIRKKRSEGGMAIPRRAPYQEGETVCLMNRSFSDPRILPDFRVESPVYAESGQNIAK
jgi:hypothetical protein